MGNFADAFKNRQNLGKNVQSETNERAQRNKSNGNPKGGEGRRENADFLRENPEATEQDILQFASGLWKTKRGIEH